MTTATATAEALQRFARSPRLFREALMIEVDGTLVRFGEVQDPWQYDDFRVMDGAWRRVADPSVVEWYGPIRTWQERPRGHSKTLDLSVQSLWALCFAPRQIFGAVAAADRDQARLLRTSIEKIVRANEWLRGTLDVKNWAVENSRTGSELTVLAADHSSAYGLNLDFLCLDEVCNWPDAGEQLWTALISTAAKRPHCLVSVITNAGFDAGSSWQWRVREVARESEEWHFSRLDGSVASWISEKLLNEQKRLLPSPAYRRLWENKWTSGKGDLLTPEQVEEATVLEGRQWTRDGQAVFYVAGLDLGWRKDRSALVILACYPDCGGLVKLAYCKDWDPKSYGGELPLDLVEREILELYGVFGFAVCFDPREAVGMAQRLVGRGVRMLKVATHAKAQQNMVSHLLTAFTEGSVELYPHKALKDDLLGLSVIERASGLKIVADRSDAGHSDLAIAFVYGLLLGRQWSSDWRTQEAERNEVIVM